MSTKIFVNLAVKDLKRSQEFFTKLGYSFNHQFTDENAACLVISEDIYAMLLLPEFFKKFTKKEIADTSATIESTIALSADSRKEVDDIADKALEAGGKEVRAPDDQGWMYSRSFEDLDGHQWEVIWMDQNKIQNSHV